METGASVNIIIPTTEEGPAEPDPRTMSEDGDASDSTSTRPADRDPDIDRFHTRLILQSVIEPSEDDEDVDDPRFDIDVVHVLGDGLGETFDLSLLADHLPTRSRKREYQFRFNVSGMFNDDVEFTKEYVDSQARQLLRALADSRQFRADAGDEPGQTATIFFAYGIGAVILKKAISIASDDTEEHVEMFTSIARIVFCGCFNRGGEQELGLTLLGVLDDASLSYAEGDEPEWKSYITLSSVQNLVATVRLGNAAFLATKISMRSRVFSLYAGSFPRRVHLRLGYHIATLGLASELAIQEEDPEDRGAAFPELMENIGARMSAWAHLRPSQVALERSVLSLVAPEAPMLNREPPLDHPILSSDSYHTWRRHCGTQVMHIEGLDPRSTTEAAEQLSMDWIKRQQWRSRYYARSFVFRFCASDPARNSTTAMLTSCLLHFFRVNPSVAQSHQDQLQDQYKLQKAWTEEDLCNMAINSYAWMDDYSPLVLLGLDECDPASRRRFWTLFGKIASRSEEEIRIIVTGSKPGAYSAQKLREELKDWPEVNIGTWEAPDKPEIDTDPRAGADALLTRLCPPQFGDARIRETLERFQSMDPNTLSSVLNLVSMYSRWPAEESKDNLTIFLNTVNLVDPSHTPRETAWAILQSAPDPELVMIALTWMLGAQRPLTLVELAGIVAFSRKINDKQQGPPEAEEIERYSREIDRQLRGFGILEGGHFRIHPDIRELLADGSTEGWEELKKRAPRLTAKVILQYLRLDATQERLRALFHPYEDRVRQSGDAVTPPINPDGKNMLFYAVHALPHHLSGIEVPDTVEEQMKDGSGPYEAWSKLFWAMSNPFSRAPSGPHDSAWSTWQSTPEFGPPSMVRLRGANGQDKGGSSAMESLAKAVRANNEDMAISFAEDVISNFKRQPSPTKEETLTFPPPILWRATWLDMSRLLDLLLSHSKQQDDSSAIFSPSMLYMACRVPSPNSVDVLLKHDADIRIKRLDKYTPLYNASSRGNIEIVQSLIRKDPTLLTLPQPDTPLYAASSWGCWKVVEALLDSNADPGQARTYLKPAVDDEPPEYDWMPITVVSSNGFVRTARVLLDHDADPETRGPWGADTCLWLAAMHSGSLETMEALLENGANPNHENIEQPILSEIIQSARIPDDTKIKMFDLLLDHDPPVDLDKANGEGSTPLMAAATAGNQSAVQWLLAKGASINALDSGEHTALYLATVEGRWDVVHQLLGHHEKPLLDLICTHGHSQLQEAMRNIDELKNFLEAGSDPSFVNKWEQTLLDCAVSAGATDVVKMLLESGRDDVDVHHRDIDGWSPILVSTGDVPSAEITRMLMEAGASLSDTTAIGSSPLHLAASKSRPDVLQVLLDFHEPEDLSRKSVAGLTPLLAVRDFTSEETLECIRLLVRAGADINSQDSDGRTLLTEAAGVGPGARAIHNWLLARPKIDIHVKSVRDGTALHAACEYGDEELVDSLLRKGADANSQNQNFKTTPLIAACMPGRHDETEDVRARIESAEKIVRALVARGADVSLTSGLTVFNPLSAAALCAGVGTINFLLDKAASVRSPDPLGRLPVHFSAGNGVRNFEAVALAHGEDVMVPDSFGKNALHWAAQFGHAETVRAILQRLSAKDKKRYASLADADGWSPLAWASRPMERDYGGFWARSEPQDYEATVRHLIENGGDILVRFSWGKGDEAEEFTPLKMAKRCEADAAVIELLTPEGETGSQSGEEPIYERSTGFCDFCFVQLRGIGYFCETCDRDRYWLCKKCLSTGSVEHPRSATFEGAHTFDAGSGTEFVTRSEPSPAPVEPGTSGEDALQADGDARGRADESTPEFEPMDFPEGDIEQLDFPDLNELGGLEDL